MDKNYLHEKASLLKTISPIASEEYAAKADELISKMNEKMLSRPDIEKLVGKDNLGMMKDNHGNHVRFLASIMSNYNPNVMVDTVLWVFNAYQNHGFASQYWSAQLNTWICILKENLSKETYLEIEPFYEWMQVNIPVFVKLSGSTGDLPESAHH
jgi:hypothetical protein